MRGGGGGIAQDCLYLALEEDLASVHAQMKEGRNTGMTR